MARLFRLALVVSLAAVAAIGSATASAPAASAAEAGDVAPDDFVLTRFLHEDDIDGFSDTWGAARSGGRRHQGTDVMAPKGTPVVAVADGFVEAMEDGRRSGYYVRLRHADNWVTWYIHLNNDTPGTDDGSGGPEAAFAPGLEVGDFVAAGDVIGYTGDSGNAESRAAHTHFELQHNDRYLNPYPYLQAAWDRLQRELELIDEAL
jgi:murein DD-endopeptidase MepM/ murein hydrolase activator NlpD